MATCITFSINFRANLARFHKPDETSFFSGLSEKGIGDVTEARPTLYYLTQHIWTFCPSPNYEPSPPMPPSSSQKQHTLFTAKHNELIPVELYTRDKNLAPFTIFIHSLPPAGPAAHRGILISASLSKGPT